MSLPRVPRSLFVLLLVAAVLATCSLWPWSGGANIVPGGGRGTDLTKSLEAGKLNPPRPEAAAGGPRPTASQSAGPMTPGPTAPAREGRVPASGESSMPRMGGEAEAEPVDIAKLEAGIQAELSNGKKQGKAAPKRWQRQARPQIARVYIGAGNALDLRRMRITVTVEGARARTVVDHVFQNPEDYQLEGTFEYPLPARAAPSYYAMFLTPEQRQVPEFFPGSAIGALPPGGLATMQPAAAFAKVDRKQWGELREARVVAKEKARRVYEEIVRDEIDPALLEYAGGNTFRGRVFPIQPKGLNRVIVAYEQHLDVVDGVVQYRLPLPDCKLDLLHVTVVLDQHGVRHETLLPSGAARKTAGGKIVYDHAWEAAKGPGGDLVLSVEPDDPGVQVTTGPDPDGGGRSFYARIRPELPAATGRGFADRAVFMLDTSFSEDPDRFNANLAILQQVLTQDTAITKFNVMCFDVGAAWVEPKGWVTNDAAGRARVTRRLQDVLLEGATDLSSAVGLLDATSWQQQRTPGYVFLLTDGQVNWGERDVGALAKALENCAWLQPQVFCYRTGISAENLDLFRALTRAGGGIFNAFTAAMAERVGLAHRRNAFLLQRVEVAGARDLLIAGRQAAVFPGGEVVVAGRHGDDAPREIVLHGTLQGEARTIRVPVAMPKAGTLADRAWAELAVNQMLALGDQALEPLATAYAQRYRIGSRVTSFLVLEKDSDYQEYHIAKEASSLAVDDVAAFLTRRYADRPARLDRKAAWQAFLATRDEPVATGRAGKLLQKLHEQDCRLPPGVDTGVILSRDAAGADYLRVRSEQRQKVKVFVDEASRRIAVAELAAGVKALSTVVETHPGRSDAMRLVGYRLLSLGQPGPAAQVFDRVRLQRPFEPHSYRDLARSLELSFRYPLAALQYEILLAGKWHERFESIKVVARDEYLRLLQQGRRSGSLSSDLQTFFRRRYTELRDKEDVERGDLRVTISWNTDSTDIDLWVVEPSGEACGYSNEQTANGGKLLDDMTSGYGPERYQIQRAPPGDFVVLVRYYSANPNLIAGETHVDVVVERRSGRPGAETRRFQVVLGKEGEAFEVCRIRM